MSIKNPTSITTLGALKRTDYTSRSIKDELRENLVSALKEGKSLFKGILGYDESVIPELQTAILSRHNLLLLGLRGQAKTRIARQLVELLDEWMPAVRGSELNDDPLAPLSRYAKDLIAEQGEDTPIEWIHRADRYTEKLATPDVSVADLIGDMDPIRAATLKLAYGDERVIHFGLIPRSHRGIFVINELPDLQARIQVALFNILQEKDIQIRGFKLRLPLDIQFVFTANPEDYTNRGSIVTPLKDRIESQILTHYPRTLELSHAITQQEARLTEGQRKAVKSHLLMENIVEQVALEARQSEFVDPKSGVSARLTIAGYENLISAAERRMLLAREAYTHVRFTDLYGIIPSITGKVELVYEGEQEGPAKVANALISKAIRAQFGLFFPNPEKVKRAKQANPYQDVIDWFGSGHTLDLLRTQKNAQYADALNGVKGLKDLVKKTIPGAAGEELLLYMEFVLHGLAEYSQLSKSSLEKGLQFKDMLGSIFNIGKDDDEEEDDAQDERRSRRR